MLDKITALAAWGRRMFEWAKAVTGAVTALAGTVGVAWGR